MIDVILNIKLFNVDRSGSIKYNMNSKEISYSHNIEIVPISLKDIKSIGIISI